jgi:hypothetical protein
MMPPKLAMKDKIQRKNLKTCAKYQMLWASENEKGKKKL